MSLPPKIDEKRIEATKGAIAPSGKTKVITIHNPFDPSDHRYKFVDWKEDKPIIGFIGALTMPDTAVVSCSGKIIPKEEWDSFIVPEDQTVVVCEMPAGGDSGKDILRLAAILAVTIFAPGIAGWLAPGLEGAALGALTFGVSLVGAVLVNALLPPSLGQEGGLDESPSYGLDGPKNTSVENIPVPVCYGQFRMAGNIISLSTENQGDNQFLYMLFNAGEGVTAGLTDVEINDQPLANYEDVEVISVRGSETQPLLEWFGDQYTGINKGITLDTNWTTHTGVNVIDKFRLDFLAPLGLIWVDEDDGDRKSNTIALDAQYRISGSSDPWVDIPNYSGGVTSNTTFYDYYDNVVRDPEGDFGGINARGVQASLDAGDTVGANGEIFDSNGDQVGSTITRPTWGVGLTITRRSSVPVRWSAYSPAVPEGIYDIRVRRQSAEHVSDSVQDRAVLADVWEIARDDVRYINTSLLALRIRLDDQINGVPNVTYLNHGRVILYWDDTLGWKDGPSNNPAWVAHDILTSTRFGASIPRTRLDMEKFKEWGKYCEDNGLTFNGVIDTRQKLWDALMNVFRAGHARPMIVGTKFSAAVEMPTTPTMMFTVGNIIQGSFSQSWGSLADRANEIEVSYFDKADRYKQRTIKVYDENVASGAPAKNSSITLYGITDKDRAFEEAVFHLKMNKYLTSTCSFEASLESIACAVGDTVVVQHTQPEWSTGGRLASGSTTTTLNLDREMVIESGKSYELLIHINDIQRYSGTVASVASNAITLNGYSGQTDIKRIQINGKDLRVTGIFSNGVYVDDPSGISGGQSYTLHDVDVIETQSVTNGAGTYTSLTVGSAYSQAPVEFANWMCGEVGVVNKEWRVMSIDARTDHTRTINCLEYDANIYNWTSGIGGAVQPVGSWNRQVPHVTNLEIAESDVVINNQMRPVMQLGWTPPDIDDYAGVEIQLSKDGEPYLQIATVPKGTDYFEQEGLFGLTYTYRVISLAEDVNGLRKAPSSTAPTAALLASGDTIPPDDVTGVAVTQGPVGIVVDLTAPVAIDYAGSEIKRNVVDNEGAATIIFFTERHATSYLDPGANDANQTYYYWVRSVDYAGNTGAWVAATGNGLSPQHSNAIVGFLDNEAHTLAANSAGTVSDWSGAKGQFFVFDGLTDVTASATFSIETRTQVDAGDVDINTADNTPINGQVKGYYEVRGMNATDASVKFRATYNGATIDKVFTLTKSVAGTDAVQPVVVSISTDANTFTYDNASGTSVRSPGAQVATFTASRQGTANPTVWTLYNAAGTLIDGPTGHTILGVAGDVATLDITDFDSGAPGSPPVKMTVRAAVDGEQDEYSIYRLLSGADGADGTNAKTVQLTSDAQNFSYDNSSGTPALIAPSSILFTVSEQNTVGSTTWQVFDDTGAEITPVSNVLTSMTDSNATLTEANFAGQTNNTFLTVRATIDGIADNFTVYELLSGTDGAGGTASVTGLLTNEAHTVFSNNDGTGYSLAAAGGTFKVWQGTTLLDPDVDVTYSVVGGATKNSLTISISDVTGVYTLSGGSWGSDSETFTLRAVYGPTTIDKEYSISKSKTGSIGNQGPEPKILRITTSAQVFTYDYLDNSTGASSAVFNSFQFGSGNTVNWKTQRWNGSAWVDTATNRMSPTTGASSTLTETDFATQADDQLRVYAWFTDSGTFDDAITVAKLKDAQPGEHAIVGYLTNESHVVAADNDGTNYALGGGSGIFEVYEGITSRTAAATHSVVGSATKNGLTISISDVDGSYSLSGASWTSDSENFTVRAVYGGVTIDKVYTITKSKEGIQGPDGFNSATVTLWNKNTSDVTPPSAFSGTFTYTFSTAVLSGGTLNGWSQTPPALSPGDFMWARQASAVATGTSDSIPAGNFAGAVVTGGVGLDGTPGGSGADGLNNATVYLFHKNTSSVTPPTSFSGTFTYTFSSGVLSAGTLAGWAQDAPDIAQGEYLWMAQATASANISTDSVPAGEFSTPVVIAIGGTDGAPGDNAFFIYHDASAALASKPAAPAGTYNPPASGAGVWHTTRAAADNWLTAKTDSAITGGNAWGDPGLLLDQIDYGDGDGSTGVINGPPADADATLPIMEPIIRNSPGSNLLRPTYQYETLISADTELQGATIGQGQLLTYYEMDIGEFVSTQISIKQNAADTRKIRLTINFRESDNTLISGTTVPGAGYATPTGTYQALALEGLVVPALCTKIEMLADVDAGTGGVLLKRAFLMKGHYMKAFSPVYADRVLDPNIPGDTVDILDSNIFVNAPAAAGATANTGALADLDDVDLNSVQVTGTLPVSKADAGLKNVSISINGSGIQGIGTGNGTFVKNSDITLSNAGVLTGGGTSQQIDALQIVNAPAAAGADVTATQLPDLDALADGTIHKRVKATALTAGEVDLSLSGVINKSLANIDGAADTKLAGIATGADVTSANTAAAITGQGALATKSSVNLNSAEVTNKSLLNLDATANTKLAGIEAGADVTPNLDGIAEGTTYKKIKATALTSGEVDLALSGVINKSLANIDGAADTKLAGIATGATVGADWLTNLSTRPTELTDGRITTGLDASGNLLSGFNSLMTIDQITGSLRGTNVATNPEFINSGTTGYTIYDNGSSGSITLTREADQEAPNGSGYVLKIASDGTGSPAPGRGGILQTLNSDTILKPGKYVPSSLVLYKIWAKVPSGRNLEQASNSTGTVAGPFGVGTFTKLNSWAGTGDWKLYLGVRTIGASGTFGATGHLYVDGAASAFDWYVAKYEQIDVTSATSTFIAPNTGLRGATGLHLGETELLNTNQDFADVGGATKPADNADVTSSKLSGAGVNIANPRFTVFDTAKGVPSDIIAPTRCTLAISSDVPSEASFLKGSMTLTNTTANDSYVYLGTSALDYNIPIEAGKKYLVSGWTKCDQASKNHQVYLKNNFDQAHHVAALTSSGTPDTWVKFAIVVTPHASATALVVRLDGDDAASSTATVHFAGVMIEEYLGDNTIIKASAYVPPAAHSVADMGYTGALGATVGVSWDAGVFEANMENLLPGDTQSPSITTTGGTGGGSGGGEGGGGGGYIK